MDRARGRPAPRRPASVVARSRRPAGLLLAAVARRSLYVGATDASIGRRVTAIARTELGDRRPHSGAHWLKTLRSLDGIRVWWTLTDAPEEYEDALLAAFAAAVPPTDLAALPDREVVLPWANLRRPTGERKSTGLTGSLLADPDAAAPAKPTFVVQVPDGDADGANGEPPAPKARAATTRTPRATPTPRARPGAAATAATGTPAAAPVVAAEALTADGAARLRAELDELTNVRRREVIARIRTAKEHGDLKENSDYHAAREEQSFLEGRVQAIEARLRSAVIVDAPVAGSTVGLGSVVSLDDDGEAVTYTIVGADEFGSQVGSDLVVVAGRPRAHRPRRGRRGGGPDASRRAPLHDPGDRLGAGPAAPALAALFGRFDQLVLDRVEGGLRP